MDSLSISQKDFLDTIREIRYGDLESDGKKLTLIKIMHKLRLWLLKSQNIRDFVDLYGANRLRETYVIRDIYSTGIKYVGLYDAPFSEDYVMYILCRDIHGDVTIDDIEKYLEKHPLNNKSLFFKIIASYDDNDMYYLTLLEEFGDTSHILKILYDNMKDRELFMTTMFGCVRPCVIEDFIFRKNLTQKMMDALVSNILSDKYNVHDIRCCLRILSMFKKQNIEIPYEELVRNVSFMVLMIKEAAYIIPNDICDIIAEHSDDSVDLLERYDIYGYSYGTIKLAQKSGNMKCAKYMKKNADK